LVNIASAFELSDNKKIANYDDLIPKTIV